MPDEQNFQNHSRYVPGFHFVTAGLLILNLAWSLVRLIRVPSLDSAVALCTAVALCLLFWYMRTFPLAVQNRVIRLEERIRLARILPPDLQPSIERFTHGQLVALRFATDAELPELARTVLQENLQDQRAIKGMIRTWRPDYLRA